MNQSAAVTGTLGFANGGTGLTSIAKGSILVANSANTISALDGGGSTDKILLYSQSSDTLAFTNAVDGGTFFEQIMDREQKPMKPKSLETRLKEGKHGKMLRNLQMKALRRKTRIKGRAGAFEAVSPAQQAAIAISKKERGEKPKKENVMDSYRQMWEDGEKYAPIEENMERSIMKKMRKGRVAKGMPR